MNRRQYLVSCIAFAACFSMLACSGKKETSGQSSSEQAQVDSDKWVEMDDFHFIMAESFHPYKDSLDLKPAKANAAAMAIGAAKWADAPLPEKVNNEGVKTKLQQLKIETAAFAEHVQSADDKTIGEELTKLHDLFHSIQEEWYGGHHEH